MLFEFESARIHPQKATEVIKFKSPFLFVSDTLYDVPTGMIVLLSVLYGSISVLAVVGNFLVMWIVATSRRMQSVTNCYIANLALADIVIGLFAIPFQVSCTQIIQIYILTSRYFHRRFCSRLRVREPIYLCLYSGAYNIKLDIITKKQKSTA